MKTGTLIAIMAIIVSVSGVTTWAQDFEDGRKGMRGRPDRNPEKMKEALIGRILENPDLADRIGLSDEQKTALRDGYYALKKEKITKRAELELAAIEQARILTESEIDESALMTAVEETGRVRTELAKIQMKTLLLMHRTLDEEQRHRISEMAHQHMKSRMEQRSRGSGRKGGDRRRHGSRHDDHDHDREPFEEHDETTSEGEE